MKNGTTVRHIDCPYWSTHTVVGEPDVLGNIVIKMTAMGGYGGEFAVVDPRYFVEVD